MLLLGSPATLSLRADRLNSQRRPGWFSERKGIESTHCLAIFLGQANEQGLPFYHKQRATLSNFHLLNATWLFPLCFAMGPVSCQKKHRHVYIYIYIYIEHICWCLLKCRWAVVAPAACWPQYSTSKVTPQQVERADFDPETVNITSQACSKVKALSCLLILRAVWAGQLSNFFALVQHVSERCPLPSCHLVPPFLLEDTSKDPDFRPPRPWHLAWQILQLNLRRLDQADLPRPANSSFFWKRGSSL